MSGVEGSDISGSVNWLPNYSNDCLASWLWILPAEKHRPFYYFLARHFRHKRHDVAFGVAEVGQPQVVVGHSGYDVRFAFGLHFALDQAGMSGFNIRNFEVQDGGRVIELRAFRRAQHQADAAAIEEGQTAGGEEQLESEYVTVELDRAIGIVHVDGDLANLRDGGGVGRGMGCHFLTSW